MYKVFLNGALVTEVTSESQAIHFAVTLHLASTVEHTIEVCKDNGFICTLIRK